MDIIAHTWDHPAPHTIVIISGDRDLAYMIGTLRMRKYEVILISPNGTHTGFANQASVNLDWIADGHRRDVDDTRDGQPPSSPHPPSTPHQFPSPSFPSPPLPAVNGFYSHYPKTNFLSNPQETDPPVVELRGMPTARGRQKPVFSHSDRFNIFGNSGASSPSPSVSNNGMFGLGDIHSQPHPARQVRSDSAPPAINAIHSPVSPLDSNGFGRIAKGKQRQFPITELASPLTPKLLEEPPTAQGLSSSTQPSPRMEAPSYIAPSSPLTPKLPEEPPTAEGLSSSTQPSARMEVPSSIPTTPEPVSIGNDNRTEREKSPFRKEEAISSKKSSHQPIQPQAPDPFPTPRLLKAPQSKQTTINARAGPSSRPVPPHFQVLVDTLRQHGGSHLKSSLPVLLLKRDQAVYKKAQVSKYTRYIATAVEANLVREVFKTEGCHIFLTNEYV